MTYTISSAAYANREQTAAILQTQEAGAIVVSEADTPDLWDAMLGWGTPAEFAEPGAPVPTTISDRQFAQQAAIAGLITQDEALAWVGPGVIPASLLALVGELPAAYQFPAKMMLTGATIFDRTVPMTITLTTMFGWNDEARAEFWKDAAALP